VSEEAGFEMVMPFVTVTSKGGPHDDDAYTAGWEMGALDALLEYDKPLFHEQYIQAVNREQADLIAMKHGYRVNPVETGGEDWLWLELSFRGVREIESMRFEGVPKRSWWRRLFG
jgi:hypothetical protein